MSGSNRKGFAADLSSEAQSRRAKKNKGRTPWRCGPICPTRKAHASFQAYNVKIDNRKDGRRMIKPLAPS